MRVTVLRGISGAGKSTWVKQHAADARIVSADRFFIVDGEYRFDPSKLQENHGKCFRAFMDAIRSGEPHIVVDNTNIEAWEYSPYVIAAEAFGYVVELLTLDCTVEASLSRKALVNKASLERMHQALARETEQMPKRFQYIHRIEKTC
ncbi:AAA family ATPase [Candidatus Uhrbacteria bacterium]|nr:AAA family ATPase [Candidatus Uhrbacteria bacterium]